FCAVTVERDHSVSMVCEDTNTKWQSCQAMQSLNVRACESTPIDFTAHLLGQCDFCCRDLQCVKSHLEPAVTTVLPMTSQTTPTVTPHTTTTATSSQAVNSTTMTQLTTAAPHPPPGINSCYTSPCLQGDPATCTSGQWACGDDQMTTADTNTSPVTSTQQAGVGCENYHADDACENYKQSGLCTDNYIVGICQRTCNACDMLDVHCVDTHAGNCSADFAGRCSENDVRQQCHKTCGSCDCQDLYKGDCAVDYLGQCSNLLVRNLCPRTCYACHGVIATLFSEMSQLSTDAPDNTLPTSTSVPSGSGVCAVCDGLNCLLVDPSGHKCTPSEGPYCMTTVTETHHGRDIKRSCADFKACHDIELDSACKSIENHLLTTGKNCSYCCSEPNCNAPPALIPSMGLMTHHP
ncbi:hypothetical protein BaRGS_00021516, partial [Batillaria attramentaria]